MGSFSALMRFFFILLMSLTSRFKSRMLRPKFSLYFGLHPTFVPSMSSTRRVLRIKAFCTGWGLVPLMSEVSRLSLMKRCTGGASLTKVGSL